MRESNNCELRVCIEHAIIRTQYIEYVIYSASVHVHVVAKMSILTI